MPVAIHPVDPSFDAPLSASIRSAAAAGRSAASPPAAFNSTATTAFGVTPCAASASCSPTAPMSRPPSSTGRHPAERPVTAAQHDRYRRGFPPNPATILVPQGTRLSRLESRPLSVAAA